MNDLEISRRTAVAGVGLAALAGGAVSACATGGEEPAPTQNGPVATTSEIPVGGGTVVGDQKVVITQPAEGTFKAFSSTCTHQGCTVRDVADGTINCPCHGSKFAIADGSVAAGPAPRPLPEREITVEGDRISLA
ncbi:MAG: Rieske (2Fe-2S) protein [Haloechinothrix sp.]